MAIYPCVIFTPTTDTFVGGGFEGLSNWAKTGLIVGVVAIVLTSIQLFRVNR